MYASRLFLNEVKSKGFFSSTEKPYAFESWMASEMAAALKVIFFGTQLCEESRVSP